MYLPWLKFGPNEQKKAARTVICSCREASDATCISRIRKVLAEELSRAATHASVDFEYTTIWR
jgi:hypothetical protein